MTLRWRKDPPVRGLRAVCAGPRGSGLYDGEAQYAATQCMTDRKSWFWYTFSDSTIEHMNSCRTPVADEATAKADAMAYVKKHLAKASSDSGAPKASREGA